MLLCHSILHYLASLEFKTFNSLFTHHPIYTYCVLIMNTGIMSYLSYKLSGERIIRIGEAVTKSHRFLLS